VEKAAQITKEDICAQPVELDRYPTEAQSFLNADVLPCTLTDFLETIVATKAKDSCSIHTNNKQKVLGQAIVAACRIKSFLTPILLGVGVFLHRHYGSRQLVDLLSNLGFSCTYNKVLRYENCVIAHETAERTHGELSGASGDYIKFAFDNADVNVWTVTGHGAFHSVGSVMMSTPAPNIPEKPVTRQLHVTTAAVTAGHGHMDITRYKTTTQLGLRKIIVKERVKASAEIISLIEHARALE